MIQINEAEIEKLNIRSECEEEIKTLFRFINKKKMPDLEKKFNDYKNLKTYTQGRIDSFNLRIEELKREIAESEKHSSGLSKQYVENQKMNEYILLKLEKEIIDKKKEIVEKEIYLISDNLEALEDKKKSLVENLKDEENPDDNVVHEHGIGMIDQLIEKLKNNEEDNSNPKTDEKNSELNPRSPKLLEEFKSLFENKRPIVGERLTKDYINWLKSKGIGV